MQVLLSGYKRTKKAFFLFFLHILKYFIKFADIFVKNHETIKTLW
jgi:hypothetical protein